MAQYKIIKNNKGRQIGSITGSLYYLTKEFKYILVAGIKHQYGKEAIEINPKSIQALIHNLNIASEYIGDNITYEYISVRTIIR